MRKPFPKARWLLRVQQLRAKLYEHDTLSEADRVALVRLLDAVLTGKDAAGIGRGALEVFGVRRAGGRPTDDSDALAAEYVWNAHRFGVPVETIAAATGWTVEAVRCFLEIQGARVAGSQAE